VVVYSVFVGILGLVIGSFLNVVIWRVPNGESIVKPGSHCPKCGHFLKAWELVPVLSYIILKGKCHNCGSKISLRYPAVEMLTGILYFFTAYTAKNFGVWELGLNLTFISLLIVLAFIDLDSYRLPDVLVLPAFVVGILKSFVIGDPEIWRSLVGALITSGIFYLIAIFYSQGMGMGDVKFVAALGAFLGFPDILLAVFLASLIGVVAVGLMLIFTKKGFRDPIPFGPFLVMGTLLIFFLKDWLLSFVM